MIMIVPLKLLNFITSKDKSLVVFAIIIASLLSGCSRPLPPEEQRVQFCQTVESINAGSVDTTGLGELAGHALVLQRLLDVAPDEIEDDMAMVHNTFESWAAAVSGEHKMMNTFEVINDPSLVGAEGRIADYIADGCGIRFGDGSYNEAPRTVSQEYRRDRKRVAQGDICAGWPLGSSPINGNNFPYLPDISGANYFGQAFIMARGASLLSGIFARYNFFAVEPGSRVELRGQYPCARYFAYHPNDMDLNNLKTLRDVDLDPDEGSVNPFRQIPEPGSNNYYTAKLVFTAPPENPEPNTTYVGAKKDGKTTNRLVFNMLRLYASDVGNSPNSGGVPLPALTIYDADGEITDHFDECDLYAPENEPLRSDLQFPILPIADHLARNPPIWSMSSNFDAPSDTMANADAQYATTYYSRRFGDVYVVRAKYMTAPNTRAGEPHSTQGKDIRLYTLCTYNIWTGSAIQCMLESELEVDNDGYYTLVISDEEHRPQNLAEQHATWIDSGPYLDGQLKYRFVYRENPKVEAIAQGLSGRPVAAELRPYVPVSVPCTRATFEAGGWESCYATNQRALGLKP